MKYTIFEDLEIVDSWAISPSARMGGVPENRVKRIRSALSAYARRQGWRCRSEFKPNRNPKNGEILPIGTLYIWRYE